MSEKIRDYFLDDQNFEKQMKEEVEPFLQLHCVQGNLNSFDGTRVCFRVFQEDTKKGKIFLIHGFSEFSEKYNELVYYFLKEGYSVYLLELRGHGDSERKVSDLSLVHVNDFGEYVDDLKLFYQEVFLKREKEFNDRKYMFAHSMGGAVGALYLEKYPENFTKAVLSSPMIRMKTGSFPFPAAFAYAGLQRKLGHGKEYAVGQKRFHSTPNFAHSSCTSEVRYTYTFQKRLEDINHQTWGASYDWVYSACKVSMRILKKKNMEKVKLPVLIFAAGKDHMVDPMYVKRFAYGCVNAKYQFYAKAKHEIFNAEKDIRREFYEKLFSFLAI